MYRTDQENFWAGDFGNDYISRNIGAQMQANVVARWARILAKTCGIKSVLELGANIGTNLLALRTLLPGAQLEAVEINELAFSRLSSIPGVIAHHGSILDYKQRAPVDLAFTSGVLIHVNPDALQGVYTTLYQGSARFVMVCEYYNPNPVEVAYRGHSGKLFKRDFAGDLMSLYPDLHLVDYGFVYHKDPVFPGDDLTWFMMEKKKI